MMVTRVGVSLLLLFASTCTALEQFCTAHTDCTEDQYCSRYTTINDNEVQDCYPCVDNYYFSCSMWGDSFDGSCAHCADEEQQFGGYDPGASAGCHAHNDCSEHFYCFAETLGNISIQDCYPCIDSLYRTCTDYGDSIDGSCDTCGAAPNTTSGCTSHADCADEFYCSSYMSLDRTTQIVTCQPCIDGYGYTCEDYGDSVNGRCDRCLGVESPPQASGSATDCVNPGDSNSPIAYQTCHSHSDCPSNNYCSSYMGDGACIVDCWPCHDQYNLDCTDYGDAIDGSCSACQGHASPSPSPTPSVSTCTNHTDCEGDLYCAHSVVAAGEQSRTECVACIRPDNSTCKTHRDSVDNSCTVCTADSAALAASSANSALDNNPVAVALVAMFAVCSGCALCGAGLFAYKKFKSSYRSMDDRMALRYDTAAPGLTAGVSASDDIAPVSAPFESGTGTSQSELMERAQSAGGEGTGSGQAAHSAQGNPFETKFDHESNAQTLRI